MTYSTVAPASNFLPQAGEEKFSHLDALEVEKVTKAIQEKQDWFNRMCADVNKMVGGPFDIVKNF